MATDVDIPFPTRELRVYLRELTRIERQVRLLVHGQLEALDPALPRAPEALRDRLAAQIAGTPQRARREWNGASPLDVAQMQYVMARVGDLALAAAGAPTGVPPGILRALTDDFPRPPLIAPDVLDQIDELLDALAAGLAPESEDAEEAARLALQRRLLLDKVAARRPDLLAPAGAQLFPDAYRQSQGNGPVRYLPQIRGWIAALALALAGLLVASCWAFRDATREVGRQLDGPPRCEPSCP
jgi:hypothetical protein